MIFLKCFQSLKLFFFSYKFHVYWDRSLKIRKNWENRQANQARLTPSSFSYFRQFSCLWFSRKYLKLAEQLVSLIKRSKSDKLVDRPTFSQDGSQKRYNIFLKRKKIEKIFRFRVSCLQLASMNVQQLYKFNNYFIAMKIHWINLFSEWNILVQLHHQWK